MGVYDYDTTADNNNTTIGGIAIPEGNTPAANVNNAIRRQAADTANFLLDVGAANTTGGTASALTLTTSSTIDANRDGILLGFIAGANANVGATLNVDARGAKALRRYNDQALVAGDIVQNAPYLVIYDASANSSAGAWIVLNPSMVGSGQVADDSITTAKLSDQAADNTKLAHMVAQRVKGRAVGAGTGDPQDLTPDQLVAIVNAATIGLAATGGGQGPGTVNAPNGYYVAGNLRVDANGATLLDGQQGSYYLDAANFTGTLADARLSANVVLAADLDDVAFSGDAGDLQTGTLLDARLSNDVVIQGGASPVLFDDSITFRGLTNTAAIFGPGALEGYLQIGSLNGNTPYIAASRQSNGVTPSPLRIYTDATERIRFEASTAELTSSVNIIPSGTRDLGETSNRWDIGWFVSALAHRFRSDSVATNDDAAFSFAPENNDGLIIVQYTSSVAGIYSFNVQAGAISTVASVGNIDATTGVLGGTTGTNGRATISAHSNGRIYFENRLGATVPIKYMVMQ